jgi:hypothetical protein
MNSDQCACAHCKVILKHTDNPNGTRSDYWECADGCGQRFEPEGVKALVSARCSAFGIGYSVLSIASSVLALIQMIAGNPDEWKWLIILALVLSIKADLAEKKRPNREITNTKSD